VIPITKDVRHRIDARSGTSFSLAAGDRLKIVDTEGEQVADLFCFSKIEPSDALSSGRSIDYNETIYFTRGHKLYSNSGKVMLEIVEDSCGRHDFLVTPCSQQMFEMVSGNSTYHPSCLENLVKALAAFDLDPQKITTTFNAFMNVPVSVDGRIRVLPPQSKAGDCIIFEAKMDLFVGLTACSDEQTNNGRCKPISYEIMRKKVVDLPPVF
jgi:uncharacterized protein YcgI (DUF1989 family)